ncbi:MAG: DsbE family thiol:disulfide interchange protein [Alphaproteobacteria bacterium]|nr:DsbE family thiol:disulfide interchange protein [Alphaproteobacteria bacterium]
MRRLLYVLPVLLFAGIAYFLFRGLIAPPPMDLPSVLINKPVPRDQMRALGGSIAGFTPKDLSDGHVTVVNFFASWCVPCREEAPVLPLIRSLKGVRLYGVAYKDMPAQAQKFLSETGNPFNRLDIDEAGRAGIDWGITGVPETFVVNGQGIVLLRFQGPLTPRIIRTQLLPVIQNAQGA